MAVDKTIGLMARLFDASANPPARNNTPTALPVRIQNRI
jgi:hypothetical protein